MGNLSEMFFQNTANTRKNHCPMIAIHYFHIIRVYPGGTTKCVYVENFKEEPICRK